MSAKTQCKFRELLQQCDLVVQLLFRDKPANSYEKLLIGHTGGSLERFCVTVVEVFRYFTDSNTGCQIGTFAVMDRKRAFPKTHEIFLIKMVLAIPGKKILLITQPIIPK